MIGAIFVFKCLCSQIDKLQNFVAGLKPPRSLVRVKVEMDGFCSQMLAKGGATEEVSVEVMDRVVSMQAMSVMHGMSAVCGEVVSAVQGRLDDGASFAGLAEDRAAAQERVIAQVDKMKQSADQIRDFTEGAVKEIIDVSEKAKTWLEDVEVLEDNLTKWAKKWPRVPLTASMRNKKEHILKWMVEDTQALVAKFEKSFTEIHDQKPVDLAELRDNFNNMIRALAFS